MEGRVSSWHLVCEDFVSGFPLQSLFLSWDTSLWLPKGADLASCPWWLGARGLFFQAICARLTPAVSVEIVVPPEAQDCLLCPRELSPSLCLKAVPPCCLSFSPKMKKEVPCH